MTIDEPTLRLYRREVQKILLLTLALNLLVVTGKIVAGWIANSLAVISDGIHSSVDSANNIVGLTVIYYASRPPDEDHHYGHGKFESLAAVGLAGLLFFTCYELSARSIGRLLGHTTAATEISALTFAVMAVTLAVNVWVAWYEYRRGRQLGSQFLKADAIHTRSDIFVTLSVLGGLAGVKAGYVWLDAAIALAVAMVIAYNGYRILADSAPALVDASPVVPRRIEALVLGVPGVLRCERIRARGQQGRMFIEMVVVVENHDLRSAHAITEIVEEKLNQEFGRCDTTIHVEPAAPRDAPQ